VAGCCECGDESSGSGTTELILFYFLYCEKSWVSRRTNSSVRRGHEDCFALTTTWRRNVYIGFNGF
jgi:hypothetical protein